MATRLVQTIDTSLFSPSSPDPAGIVYINTSNQLLISDSEVEETSIFAGANLYQSTLDGTLVNSGNTLGFSDEPTGLAYDSLTGTLFVSDDKTRRVYRVASGSDGVFGTSDDTLLGSFNTRAFGNNDPEDVTFASDLGNLFLAGGKDNRIYEVSTNGTLISSFDTASIGLNDPEGVVYNSDSGHLFVVGQPADILFEVTTDGKLVQKIDISDANGIKPAGIAYAPSSDNFLDRSLYIVDRGIDESVDPNENDGKIYEFVLGETIFATVRDNVTLNGLSFNDEDVVAYNPRTGNWSQYFDGSDVGLGNEDIDAVHINDDGSILFSLNSDTFLSGIGSVDDSDILRFVPTTTGTDTAGNFEFYFDGSDVGLNVNAEDIDAIALTSDGQIVVSTNGSYDLSGFSGNDEDLIAFSPTSLGSFTSGSWSLYLDGSDIGLDDTSDEDLKGVSIKDDGELVLSTLGSFNVTNLSGDGSDLFSFVPGTIGGNSNGTFSLFSDGEANGFGTQVIDDFTVV